MFRPSLATGHSFPVQVNPFTAHSSHHDANPVSILEEDLERRHNLLLNPIVGHVLIPASR
jgi:hypothetical protein